ncbi:hypothetical protein ACTXT7_006913 [Hymenolepis weldensis]
MHVDMLNGKKVADLELLSKESFDTVADHQIICLADQPFECVLSSSFGRILAGRGQENARQLKESHPAETNPE